MAADTPQMWYALPNTPSPVVMWPCTACAGLSTTDNPFFSFLSCTRAIRDENNNLVTSYKCGSCTSKASCCLPSTPNVANKSHSFQVQNLKTRVNEGDTSGCSKVEDAYADSIKYTLELLGGSRTSSCSTQMDWDDDDTAVNAAQGMVNSCFTDDDRSATEVTSSPINSMLNSPPRVYTAIKACPTAPKRRGPAIKLVHAAELGRC